MKRRITTTFCFLISLILIFLIANFYFLSKAHCYEINLTVDWVPQIDSSIGLGTWTGTKNCDLHQW